MGAGRTAPPDGDVLGTASSLKAWSRSRRPPPVVVIVELGAAASRIYGMARLVWRPGSTLVLGQRVVERLAFAVDASAPASLAAGYPWTPLRQ